MTKADLIAGKHVVEYRDGKRGLVFETKNGNKFIMEACGHLYNAMDYTSEDLLHNINECFDIVKVYEITSPCTVNHVERGSSLRLIWERKKPTKEITVKEACILLKEKFPEYEEIKITM